MSSKGNRHPTKYATMSKSAGKTGLTSRESSARDTERRRCYSIPAASQPTSTTPASTTPKDNPTDTHRDPPILVKNERTVYMGRGLLPCPSFIFPSEAPIPNVGRQPRVDHRAIFARANRHRQAAKYGLYPPDFDEMDISFGSGLGSRHRLPPSVPDWAAFSAGTGVVRGNTKKKCEAGSRKSGGRVRG